MFKVFNKKESDVLDLTSKKSSQKGDIPVPEVSATNWCLLTCISSCAFNNVTFTSDEIYTYIDKTRTYNCMVSCFPLQEEPPPPPPPPPAR